MDKWILHDLLSKVGISIALLGVAVAAIGNIFAIVGVAVVVVGVGFCVTSYFSAKNQVEEDESDKGNEE